MNDNDYLPILMNEFNLQIIGLSGNGRKNVSLLVLDTSLMHLGFFTCIKQDDLEEYTENDKKINDYCAKAAKIMYLPA